MDTKTFYLYPHLDRTLDGHRSKTIRAVESKHSDITHVFTLNPRTCTANNINVDEMFKIRKTLTSEHFLTHSWGQ